MSSSIIPTTPFDNAQVRSSSLNLYDAVNKTELFQVKAYSDKAELNSNQSLNLNAQKVSITNSDGKMVLDVAGTILQTALDLSTEVSNREAAVTAEENARIERDQQLTGLIEAEETARVEAVGFLQNDLNEEITARQDAVSAEAAARTAAITAEAAARTAAISAESSARQSAINTVNGDLELQKERIDAILAAADVNFDTFKEVSDKIQLIDTTSMQDINTLQGNVTELASAIALLQQQFASAFQ